MGSAEAGRTLRAFWTLLLAERDRWVLWLPVLLSLGILAYFLPVEEPAAVLAPIAAVAALTATLAASAAVITERTALATILLLLGALPAGYAVSAWRTGAITTVTLARPGTYEVTGRVTMVEGRTRGHRLTLDRIALPDGARSAAPSTVRVGVARGGDDIVPGDVIRVKARLDAPAPPALPGIYDWSRDAWFQGLGAVGWTLAPPVVLAKATERDWSTALEGVRTSLTERIAMATPGPGGAVAAALVTGPRAAVDSHVWKDMQVSGLAHLISISGVHFTLVAGAVFLVARWGLALVPGLALRIPAQKAAAAAAILACAFYLVLSGSSVPAQRSFVSCAIAFGALIADRDPISLRLVAVAALAVLVVAPESLLGPSFQLSFAAVVALVAVFEAIARRRRARTVTDTPGPVGRALAYLGAVSLTSLVATLATAPFSAWHFGNVATYGIVSNLLAVPLTSFLVMPMAVLGVLLVPLGLDQPAFMAMGWGVERVLDVAAITASWPHATLPLPAIPALSIPLTVAGGLWLAIWQRPWRLLGAPVIAVGLVTALLGEAPRLMVAPDARVVAVLTDDGHLVRSPGPLDGRVTEAWLEKTGTAARIAPWAAAAPDGACDAQGCAVRLGARRIAVLTGPGDVGDDCRHAELVLDLVAERRCPAPVRSIGRARLRAMGGAMAVLDQDEWRFVSVNEERGRRPWTGAAPSWEPAP